MNSSSSLPSTHPSLVLSSSKINDLSDTDLAEIFKHLPPYDRLIVSEVCRRWLDLSRMAWLDITHLDLGPIPRPNIGAIVKRCPNLQSVFAQRKTFGYGELACLSRVSLSSAELYDCKAIMPRRARGRITDAFATFFSAQLPSAGWTELTLHDLHFQGFRGFDSSFRVDIDFPASLPRSLKRLQYSGGYCAKVQPLQAAPNESHTADPNASFLRGLERLQDLECLMLLETPDPERAECALSAIDVTAKLLHLQNLRELCLGPIEEFYDVEPQFTLLPEKLPRLEVLFLHSVPTVALDRFLELIPTLTKLRILVLTGDVDMYMYTYSIIKVPVRKRFPNGFGGEPLPLLHVFVGGEARSSIVFTEEPADALEVHPITEPLPQFLERADIKPIFEGVWIAEKIKEAARRGFKLWDGDDVVY